MVCVFAMLFLISVFIVAVVSPEYTLTPHYRRRVGLCQACGYDLAGLGEGATCPECGRAGAASPDHVRRRRRIDPTVAARLFPLMLGAGLAACAFSAIVPVIEMWSYMLQGFPPSVAARARTVRGFDLPEVIWGLAPMCALILAAPWLAKLPRDVSVWRVILAVLGMGTVVIVVLFAAAVYVSYA